MKIWFTRFRIQSSQSMVMFLFFIYDFIWLIHGCLINLAVFYEFLLGEHELACGYTFVPQHNQHIVELMSRHLCRKCRIFYISKGSNESHNRPKGFMKNKTILKLGEMTNATFIYTIFLCNCCTDTHKQLWRRITKLIGTWETFYCNLKFE